MHGKKDISPAAPTTLPRRPHEKCPAQNLATRGKHMFLATVLTLPHPSHAGAAAHPSHPVTQEPPNGSQEPKKHEATPMRAQLLGRGLPIRPRSPERRKHEGSPTKKKLLGRGPPIRPRSPERKYEGSPMGAQQRSPTRPSFLAAAHPSEQWEPSFFAAAHPSDPGA